jgi:hypothetical protein
MRGDILFHVNARCRNAGSDSSRRTACTSTEGYKIVFGARFGGNWAANGGEILYYGPLPMTQDW